MKVNKLTRIAIFSALLCIISPLNIPVGVIPLSLASFGIYISSLILPRLYSVWAVMVYVMLGLFGLPVFSGFQGGFGVLAGPSGGFVSGYILCALVISFLKKKCLALSLIAGVSVLYASGMLWYAFVTQCSIADAVMVSVMPFVPFDAAKLAAAAAISKNRRIVSFFSRMSD